MKRDLLPHLHCPFTGSPLTIVKCHEEHAGDIVCGMVASAAGEFPIIDRILRLQADELREPIVKALRAGEVGHARRLALDWPSGGRWTAAIAFILRAAARARATAVVRQLAIFKRQLERVLSADASFCELVERLGPNAWADWQKYRFSMSNFLPIYPLLALARTDRFVLDFGCGLGHSAFLLSRFVVPGRLVCVDNSFTALVLAQRYFVPNATAICLDGNYPLPFAERLFSTILCTDVIHFVTAKRTLVQEFARILAPNGIVVAAHLHNGLSPVVSGSALTPRAYSALFAEAGLEYRLVPDRELIEAFLQDRALDLAHPRANDIVDNATEGLSLIASLDPTVFARYESLADKFVGRLHRPRINPIYHVTRDGNQWLLAKLMSAAYRNNLQSPMPDYVADNYRLKVDDMVDETVTGMSRQRLSELVRGFVVVEAPEHYA